jgi:hypothetical protein
MIRRGRPGAATTVIVSLALALTSGCRRKEAASPEQLRARIAALEEEIPALKQRIGELVAKDPRLEGMPATGVRVGVPTPLARTLIERVTTGFVDSVTLVLTNLKVKAHGSVKKMVTIGTFDLVVNIKEVRGNLKTGKPKIDFGGNRVSLALPVRIASGQGTANLKFSWDGKNVSGAMCGDLNVDEDVSGSVRPGDYPVSGALQLSATAREILAAPKFPVVKVKLVVVPSAQAWGVVQRILDSKTGLCGFVVEKVNVPHLVDGLLDKGFNVRLPTEKIKPMAIPVGIAPTMRVGDDTLQVDVKVSDLAITEHMIWLGADVQVAAAGTSPADKARPASPPTAP